MNLEKIKGDFSICKVADMKHIDFSKELLFFAKTPDEISLVCETAHAPSEHLAVEHGWKTLKVSGMLDFGMVGVIAKISNILATAGISLFVVSTYNTDYILLKAENLDHGVQLLLSQGYTVS